MATTDKNVIVLIALIDLIKERGFEEPGSDVAFFLQPVNRRSHSPYRHTPG